MFESFTDKQIGSSENKLFIYDMNKNMNFISCNFFLLVQNIYC